MGRSTRFLLEVVQSSFAVPCETLQPPHTAFLLYPTLEMQVVL